LILLFQLVPLTEDGQKDIANKNIFNMYFLPLGLKSCGPFFQCLILLLQLVPLTEDGQKDIAIVLEIQVW
jgi:hypothetical protein